jgi:hypothetical protein
MTAPGALSGVAELTTRLDPVPHQLEVLGADPCALGEGVLQVADGEEHLTVHWSYTTQNEVHGERSHSIAVKRASSVNPPPVLR